LRNLTGLVTVADRDAVGNDELDTLDGGHKQYWVP
jgi:hypothetical protein